MAMFVITIWVKREKIQLHLESMYDSSFPEEIHPYPQRQTGELSYLGRTALDAVQKRISLFANQGNILQACVYTPVEPCFGRRQRLVWVRVRMQPHNVLSREHAESLIDAVANSPINISPSQVVVSEIMGQRYRGKYPHQCKMNIEESNCLPDAKDKSEVFPCCRIIEETENRLNELERYLAHEQFGHEKNNEGDVVIMADIRVKYQETVKSHVSDAPGFGWSLELGDDPHVFVLLPYRYVRDEEDRLIPISPKWKNAREYQRESMPFIKDDQYVFQRIMRAFPDIDTVSWRVQQIPWSHSPCRTTRMD